MINKPMTTMMNKWDLAYIDIAQRFSQLSTAKKLQVGCIIVKDHRIISIGYNGTPAKWDNTCEFISENGDLITKPEVIHAERNALDKLAATNGGAQNASLYVTHSPCLECSKSIYATGISAVYYRYNYRLNDGLKFLHKCGIQITKIDD